MSYHSGINQQVLQQEFFNNTIATDQPITQNNLSLIANLKYVQNWVSSVIVNYLPVNNPTFTGVLSGPNLNLTNNLSVPTISNNVNFTGNPTIQNSSISVRKIGSIKMILSTITPENYLLCNGQSLPVANYQNLYNVIGNTYGGDTINFNLPNFQSAFPIGANGQNALNCPVSNFATGNNQAGANNTFSPSCFFGGSSSSVPPILDKVPEHNHTITDEGHFHTTQIGEVIYPLLLPPPNSYSCVLPRETSTTTYNETGIIINNTGSNIQSIDSVSGLNGVNISPPYLAVNFYICYN